VSLRITTLSLPRTWTFALDVTGLEVVGGQTQKVNIPAKGRGLCGLEGEGATRTGNAGADGEGAYERRVRRLEMTLAVAAVWRETTASGSGVVFFRPRAGWVELWLFRLNSDAGTAGTDDYHCAECGGDGVWKALDYLTGYPWGCTEQTMSSFLPDVIVAQAVDKLHLKSPIDRATLKR